MTKDYLAIITTNGVGSWAREPNKDEAIRRVCKIFKSDFGSLFDLKNQKVKVNVWDVTGHENLWWDETGMHDSDTKETLNHEEKREIVEKIL